VGAQDETKNYVDDRHIDQSILGSQGRLTMVQVDVVEVEIDGRAFWVCPVSPAVLQANNVVAAALAESMHKPLPWAVGFFFGNVELSMAVAGDYNGFAQCRRIEL
jgi:hypothetical protein